jgi:hypothetical protein
MTFSLSDVVRPLLEPEALHSPKDIARDPTVVPHEPGIYGWWFDEALPDIPREGSLLLGDRRLLYVGIAPSGARGTSGKRTLRDRLKNHCRGPVAHSTLRRTLLALGDDSRFAARTNHRGKLTLTSTEENDLTTWMAEHLRVAWMVHPQPWELEEALIKLGQPRLPLNIMGSTDTFARMLKARRATLMAFARTSAT